MAGIFLLALLLSLSNAQQTPTIANSHTRSLANILFGLGFSLLLFLTVYNAIGTDNMGH